VVRRRHPDVVVPSWVLLGEESNRKAGACDAATRTPVSSVGAKLPD
jgi:hypothetical protein